MRASGRLGYGDVDTDTPVSPGELNDVYTHGQFWVPAGSMTVGASDPATIETYEGTGAQKATYTVAKFVQGVENEAFFSWDFKADFVAVPTASMLLKFYPVWFAKTTAAGPNNVVRFESYAGNFLIGTSINDGLTSANNLDQTVPGTAFDIQGGKTADAQAGVATVVNGDVLAAANNNFLSFKFERHGEDAVDTFAGDIFLLGIQLQWAVNFNNVAVWPT